MIGPGDVIFEADCPDNFSHPWKLEALKPAGLCWSFYCLLAVKFKVLGFCFIPVDFFMV